MFGFLIHRFHRVMHLNTWGDSIYVLARILEEGIYYAGQWIGGNNVDTCGQNLYSIVRPGRIAENRIVLFPNPVANNLTIVSQMLMDKIELYDITGKLLETTHTCEVNYEINVSEYQPGCYFVRIKTNDEWIFRKILVRR